MKYSKLSTIILILTGLAASGLKTAPSKIEKIAQKAEDAQILIVNQCFLTPEVIRVIKPSNLQIINDDSIGHTLQILNEKWSIEGNSQLVVNLNLKAGYYGLLCDDQENGLLVIPDWQESE
jgi:hypothetical protein